MNERKGEVQPTRRRQTDGVGLDRQRRSAAAAIVKKRGESPRSTTSQEASAVKPHAEVPGRSEEIVTVQEPMAASPKLYRRRRSPSSPSTVFRGGTGGCEASTPYCCLPSPPTSVIRRRCDRGRACSRRIRGWYHQSCGCRRQRVCALPSRKGRLTRRRGTVASNWYEWLCLAVVHILHPFNWMLISCHAFSYHEGGDAGARCWSFRKGTKIAPSPRSQHGLAPCPCASAVRDSVSSTTRVTRYGIHALHSPWHCKSNEETILASSRLFMSPSSDSFSSRHQASNLSPSPSGGVVPEPSQPSMNQRPRHHPELENPKDRSTQRTYQLRSGKPLDSASTRIRGGGGLDGLSKFHRSILSQTSNRQRFVTGKYPITVTVSSNPTRKWLQSLQFSTTSSSASSSLSSSSDGFSEPYSSDFSCTSPDRRYERPFSSTETSILVNGTSPLRSLASFDRFQWLDDAEREHLRDDCSMVSVELISVVHLERPGYLSVLPRRGAGATAATGSRQQRSFPQGWKRWGRQDARSWLPPTSSMMPPYEGDDGDRLWVTGFSLAGRKGLLKSVDASTSLALDDLGRVDGVDGNDVFRRESPSSVIASVNARTSTSLLWPNEVAAVPRSLVISAPLAVEATSFGPKSLMNARPRVSPASSVERDAVTTATPTLLPENVASLPEMFPNSREYQDALLVCDGFLIPGKDRGGVYIVNYPGNPQAEWTVRLTSRSTDSHEHRWFYHRASWIDITGDGRLSILTARCRISTQLRNREVTAGITKTGQLVWLECPRPASIDPATGTLLESDGTVFDPFASRHLPWTEHVLQEGPDVMFCVADMDTSDDTVEVISSQFFAKRVVLQSIRRGPRPEIVFRKVIDDDCGSAFGCILAELDGGSSRTLSSPRRRVVDSGSTVANLKAGDDFSHLLVTSHERRYAATKDAMAALSAPVSLSDPFANQALVDRESVEGGSLFAYRVPPGKDSWKTEPWLRTTVATGFQVNGQLSNMINPGAPGFVYTFHARECDIGSTRRPIIAVAGDCAESAYFFRPDGNSNEVSVDPAGGEDVVDKATQYKLMLEIKCESTVGSIAIGYDEFSPVEQESGFAKIFVPCFEKDKILVFALGSGDEEDDGW